MVIFHCFFVCLPEGISCYIPWWFSYSKMVISHRFFVCLPGRVTCLKAGNSHKIWVKVLDLWRFHWCHPWLEDWGTSILGNIQIYPNINAGLKSGLGFVLNYEDLWFFLVLSSLCIYFTKITPLKILEGSGHDPWNLDWNSPNLDPLHADSTQLLLVQSEDTNRCPSNADQIRLLLTNNLSITSASSLRGAKPPWIRASESLYLDGFIMVWSFPSMIRMKLVGLSWKIWYK